MSFIIAVAFLQLRYSEVFGETGAIENLNQERRKWDCTVGMCNISFTWKVFVA